MKSGSSEMLINVFFFLHFWDIFQWQFLGGGGYLKLVLWEHILFLSAVPLCSGLFSCFKEHNSKAVHLTLVLTSHSPSVQISVLNSTMCSVLLAPKKNNHVVSTVCPPKWLLVCFHCQLLHSCNIEIRFVPIVFCCYSLQQTLNLSSSWKIFVSLWSNGVFTHSMHVDTALVQPFICHTITSVTHRLTEHFCLLV